MITFGDHVIGIWFVSWGPRHVSHREGDWLAVVQRDAGGTMFFDYRFRWYDEEDPGADPWLGKDEKTFYHGEGKPGNPDDAPLRAIRGLYKDMRAGRDIRNAEEGLFDGDSAAAMEWFASRSWAHIKAAPAEGHAS
jgi:hypothetical protein